MALELAHARLAPYATPQPARYLAEALRRHASSIDELWIQPGHDLAVPSDLRRLADARSALTLSLAGPLDLPVELRDRFYGFFEQKSSASLLRTSNRSPLLEHLLVVASRSETSTEHPIEFDRTNLADVSTLLEPLPLDTVLLVNAGPSTHVDSSWLVLGRSSALNAIRSHDETSEPLTQACALEVEALHRFFEEWFTGRLENTEEEFSRLEGALAPGFEIVTPGGATLDRASLIKSLRAAHGKEVASPDSKTPFRIWTRPLSVRSLSADFMIVQYEEWQERAGEARGRISSAVLERVSPSRMRWHHVHETWRPEDNPAP